MTKKAFFQGFVDPAVERTKNLLLEEIMVTNEKKLSNKKVRLSLAEDNVVPPAAIQVDLPDIAREEEKFGDFLKRNSSTQSSTSSIFSGPRRTSRIPSFLLNTLHDKKLLIQHVI